MFHWILSTSFINWGLCLLRLTSKIVPCYVILLKVLIKLLKRTLLRLFLKLISVTNLWIKVRYSMMYNQEINTWLLSFNWVRWPGVHQSIPSESSWLKFLLVILLITASYIIFCWSSREEIPHAQGKRNPSKMAGVARGHQRANTLKPYS